MDYTAVPEGKRIAILRVTWYVINTGTLTPNGVVRDPDVPGETPETEASQESTAATVTSTAEYQEENETVYAKENNETVQLDDVDEAVDISIQEKELEQMDVILKIIAVMIVVIGAISRKEPGAFCPGSRFKYQNLIHSFFLVLCNRRIQKIRQLLIILKIKRFSVI